MITYSPSSGSGPTTSCRACSAPSISTIRRGSGTRSSSPTGSWMVRFPRTPLHPRAPAGRRASSSLVRIRLPRRQRPASRPRASPNEHKERIMRTIVSGIAGLVISAMSCAPAAAFVHAGGWGHAEGNRNAWSAQGRRGGSASGGDGSWSGTGYRGGTASGGDGSWHGHGADGGTASGGDGSWHAHGADGGTASGGGGSWHGTGANGTTASGGYDHYYGGTYSTYHPPTVVNHYYGSGC